MGLCSPWSRWRRKRSLPAALFTSHKGDKRPFFLVLKCSPLALNTLGFSEPRSGVSGHSPLVVFFPTPPPHALQLHCPHLSAERTMSHFSAARVTLPVKFSNKKKKSHSRQGKTGIMGDYTPTHTHLPSPPPPPLILNLTFPATSLFSPASRLNSRVSLKRFLHEKINKFRSSRFSSCLLARLTASQIVLSPVWKQ